MLDMCCPLCCTPMRLSAFVHTGFLAEERESIGWQLFIVFFYSLIFFKVDLFFYDIRMSFCILSDSLMREYVLCVYDEGLCAIPHRWRSEDDLTQVVSLLHGKCFTGWAISLVPTWWFLSNFHIQDSVLDFPALHVLSNSLIGNVCFFNLYTHTQRAVISCFIRLLAFPKHKGFFLKNCKVWYIDYL